ncbi:cell division septum initiation protein DivIVA [Bradyrhizobium sp. USDA 4518]
MTSSATLPTKVHDKILRLADQERQAFVLMHSTVDRISDTEQAIGYNPADDDRLRALRRELMTLRTSHQQHQERHRELADLNARLRQYLERLPANVQLAEAKPARLKLQDGESYPAAIERVRREITGIVSERIRIEQSGPPRSEVKRRVKEWIERRGRLARPSVTATHDSFSVQFQTYLDNATAPILDMAAAFAWFDPDGFERKINELIDGMPEPRLALTASEKSERLRDLKQRLYELERVEEQILTAAEEENQLIPRRPTASPNAVLGIVVRSMANAA